MTPGGDCLPESLLVSHADSTGTAVKARAKLRMQHASDRQYVFPDRDKFSSVRQEFLEWIQHNRTNEQCSVTYWVATEIVRRAHEEYLYMHLKSQFYPEETGFTYIVFRLLDNVTQATIDKLRSTAHATGDPSGVVAAALTSHEDGDELGGTLNEEERAFLVRVVLLEDGEDDDHMDTYMENCNQCRDCKLCELRECYVLDELRDRTAMQILEYWLGKNRTAENPGFTFSYLDVDFVRFYSQVYKVDVVIIDVRDNLETRGHIRFVSRHPTGDAQKTLYIGWRGGHYDPLLPVA